MAKVQCKECGDEIELDTAHLGPIGARALMPPVEYLCPACVAALRLTILRDDETARPHVLLRGEEYRLIGGAFARSRHPWNEHVYHRDDEHPE